jgi:hypothetical protein
MISAAGYSSPISMAPWQGQINTEYEARKSPRLTDASSGSNIQYPPSLFGLDRCQEELVANGSDAHVMVEVKAVHLALVIRELVA